MTEEQQQKADDEIRRRSALWAGLCGAVFVAFYVAAPLEGTRSWVVGAVVGVMAVVVAVPFAVLRRRLGHSPRPVADAAVTVALMLVALVVGFSSIYVAMAKEDGGAIPGLDTRVDALYFTVTTLATVGFGDIYAASQSARLVVTIQMLFDLTVVAVAARLVLNVAAEKRRGRTSEVI